MEITSLVVKTIRKEETEKEEGTIEKKTILLEGAVKGVAVSVSIRSEPDVLKEFDRGEKVDLLITNPQTKLTAEGKK